MILSLFPFQSLDRDYGIRITSNNESDFYVAATLTKQNEVLETKD